ncbi:MAG TPA: glycosyltransferase [Mycobacteriales bacterium]|jgi:UDP-N-acetylglucosamine:LPS N-acetylglucosamine transferase|nr:glycosyltransferase [Mycobacteriales bacterium]
MAAKRLLIVSASMGAGHDAAAAALAAQANADGVEARIVDLLSMPKLHQGDALRAFYHGMIAVAPGLYDWAMRTWLVHPGLFEFITRNGGRSSEEPLLSVVREFRADAVVAVYNLAAQVLGRLRSEGRLTIPAATYVTDPGAHPYWVWPGVDLHLAPMADTAAGLEDMGAEVVKPVAPLIAAKYLEAVDRADARRRWHLADDARVVLVNGGSWGVGEVVAAARRLTGAADVVQVLTGRSPRLASRLAGIEKVRAVPWTSDVIGLLTAADVVVDNAGGTTCWEALAVGKPVVVYRPIAGHGRINAVALEHAGLATSAMTDADLIDAVRRAEPPRAAREVFAGARASDVIGTLW